MKKWIKIPGPGQFRGEGIWTEVDEAPDPDKHQPGTPLLGDYLGCLITGYFPTHEGEEPPDE